MPYFEVWVDPEPCNGKCDSAKDADRLQRRIEEAERLIRSGDAEAALAALMDDTSIIKSPDEIARRYQEWKAGSLPGFTNFQPK